MNQGNAFGQSSLVLDYSQFPSLGPLMQTLRDRGWEVTPPAKNRILQTYRPTALLSELVFCTPFNKLPGEDGIRSDKIYAMTDSPPIPERVSYLPCSHKAVGGLCISLQDQIQDKSIYIWTRTITSGMPTDSLFIIRHMMNIPVLDVIEPPRVIQRDEKNILVRA